jgi:hypothetical protein
MLPMMIFVGRMVVVLQEPATAAAAAGSSGEGAGHAAAALSAAACVGAASAAHVKDVIKVRSGTCIMYSMSEKHLLTAVAGMLQQLHGRQQLQHARSFTRCTDSHAATGKLVGHLYFSLVTCPCS